MDVSNPTQISAALARTFRPVVSDEWKPDAAAALPQLRTRQAAVRARARRLSWATATTATMALAAVSLPDTRAFAARCVNACVELTTKVAGRSSGRSPSPQNAGAIIPADLRAAAPELSLPDAYDQPVRLGDLTGHVVLVNFWATWCAPCVVEMPWFAALERDYRTEGLAVIGVSLDDEGWAVVRPFAAAHGVPYTIAMGTASTAAAFGGIDALPSTFLIDRHGRIASVHVGLAPESEYRAQIRHLLAER
jgi:cytochrome c biogenesis protein CcmG/thiol:disulfide interchange protein DsbE